MEEQLGTLFLGRTEDSVGVKGGNWDTGVVTVKGRLTYKVDTPADVTVIEPGHSPELNTIEDELTTTNRKLVDPDKHSNKYLACFKTKYLVRWKSSNRVDLCLWTSKNSITWLSKIESIAEMEMRKVNHINS